MDKIFGVNMVERSICFTGKPGTMVTGGEQGEGGRGFGVFDELHAWGQRIHRLQCRMRKRALVLRSQREPEEHDDG